MSKAFTLISDIQCNNAILQTITSRAVGAGFEICCVSVELVTGRPMGGGESERKREREVIVC